jgi:STE24 endopeptidase
MDSQNLFIAIVLIIVFHQLFEYFLDVLNLSYRKKPIPSELSDVFDNEAYLKQQRYESEVSRFSFISSAFSFVLLLTVLFIDGFAILDNWIRGYVENEILISLFFLASAALISSIVSIPFSLYSTFVIEEKYGFNKTNLKTFVLDLLKGMLLTVIIGGGILYLVILLYQTFGDNFWWLAWLLVTAFSLFMMMFYSQLIVPLFNKQKPLEEGELRSMIESFGAKAGFKLKNVFVIDGSKRSTKANAYFTGLGPKKRIVLYDTLINDLSNLEILAVLAHEIGHYKHKHTLKGMISSVLQTGAILFVFSLLIDNPLLNQALGSEYQSFHFGLLAFSFLMEPVSLVTGILGNVLSRKNEYQADAFAQKHNLSAALINGLKKLSRKNLSNLTPHPLYVFVHYSHPSLYQRIVVLKEVHNVKV